jgi:hypothetical protein
VAPLTKKAGFRPLFREQIPKLTEFWNLLILHYFPMIEQIFYSPHLDCCYFPDRTYKTIPNHICPAGFGPEYIILPLFQVDFLY